ncbi:hypothetical protein BDZ90DRAFT_72439 [Jaminaea rosea]|uniref:Secreted protein n=1 Tax=Jaminaea rosea TaxID=1569628 RepID=A0A316UJA1_9BASI|nr:hypothetical protein BDZ90DRAFT_72439 [Jaminaea rosea]PWN25300.1 hypothetical protein BDZ90DRAFT_72439 [Jaminaea rosea]
MSSSLVCVPRLGLVSSCLVCLLPLLAAACCSPSRRRKACGCGWWAKGVELKTSLKRGSAARLRPPFFTGACIEAIVNWLAPPARGVKAWLVFYEPPSVRRVQPLTHTLAHQATLSTATVSSTSVQAERVEMSSLRRGHSLFARTMRTHAAFSFRSSLFEQGRAVWHEKA